MTAGQAAERFEGLGPRALDFLRALAFHQDRAWYEANKALWESELRDPLQALVATLTARLRDVPLAGDARAVFRLHRDVRFAKDKRPFKTNAGAVLTRTGDKREPGLLYVHVAPDGCFAAAGFYRPDPPALTKLRRLLARPGEVATLGAALGDGGLALEAADPLSRLPRGFETIADPALSAAIRGRSFLVREPIPDAELARPALAERLADFASRAVPLLRFGWRALAAPDPDQGRPGFPPADRDRIMPSGRRIR